MNQTATKEPPIARITSIFNKLPLAAPIAGSLLLLGVGATAFWWLNRTNFTPGTLPIGANVIPQDALTVVTLNTDQQQWRQLREFGTPKSQKAFDGFLAAMRDQMFNANGLDFARDIQPWVGDEVTIAQLSQQGELSNGDGSLVPSALSAQPMVIVLPIGDPLKARELIAQPKTLTNRVWNERVHKEVKVREAMPQAGIDPQSTTPLEIAVIDNKMVLVSNSTRSMNLAIDTYRGGKSLAQTPGYAQALGQIQQQSRPFMTLYRNVPASILTAANNLDRSITKQNQEWLEQSQGFATAATLRPEGIEFRNISWLKPDSKRKFDTNNNGKSAPNRLPAETLAMFSGSNFKQFWQDYSRDYPSYPLKPFDPTLFKEGIEKSLGLNWQEDFLGWMKGEFSVSMIPIPGEAAKKTPIGLVMMAQTNDRRAAEASFKKLDDAVAGRLRYKVEPGKFNNESVTNWTDPISGMTMMHGWMNDNTAFIALGAPAASTFFPQTQAALNGEANFRQSAEVKADKDKKTPNGYFFVNFDRLFSLPQLPPLFAWLEPHRDWTEGLRAIGMSGMTTSDRTMQFNSLVLLKKGMTPGPLPAPSIKPSPKEKDKK